MCLATYKIGDRFVLDGRGNPTSLLVFNLTKIYNTETKPLFEDNFHYLTDDEYEEVSDLLVPHLPLKSYPRKGDVEPELVYKYRNKEISKEEFRNKIGFNDGVISTNPLD